MPNLASPDDEFLGDMRFNHLFNDLKEIDDELSDLEDSAAEYRHAVQELFNSFIAGKL